MGQVREEVESKILEKYREKGTITEDEIVDICLDYDLNLIEIDSICERIFSKKVIVSDDYERKNTNDEKEYADHSHTDYEYFYDKVEKEKEKEIYDSKIEFFTNVAHEIRTPLSLIRYEECNHHKAESGRFCCRRLKMEISMLEKEWL